MNHGLVRLMLLLVTGSIATGCASLNYAGQASDLDRRRLQAEPGWLAIEGVPELRQASEHSCGITALDMVAQYHGHALPNAARRALGPESRWSAGELRRAAREAGLLAYVVEGEVQDLVRELKANRPVIVGTTKQTVVGGAVAHYEVVIGIHREKRLVATLDPAEGPRENSFEGFLSEWLPTGKVLIAVLPAQTPARAGKGLSRARDLPGGRPRFERLAALCAPSRD